jgi:hypothetical protein
MISIGMGCLAVGLVAERFIHPPSDFWQGFVYGVSGSLIGLSIVFNLRGLVLQRSQRDGSR